MSRITRHLPGILAFCLLTGACGVPLDEAPRDLDRPRPASGSSAPAPDCFGTAIERLCYVRDGRLVRAVRRVVSPPTARQMLDDLLAGPTRAEQQDGLSSALSTMRIEGMTVTGRRAVVSISQPAQQPARSDEILAYGQIVCTLTNQGTEVGTVSFAGGSRPLGVPRGDGSLSTAPLTLADYAGPLDS
jgi:hypothetical protein